MARRQLALFSESRAPSPRLVRMQVADAGQFPDGSKAIQFRCKRCGHDTDWIYDVWTVTQNRRGQPCPNCNASVLS